MCAHVQALELELARIGLVRTNDADAMIGEFVVRAGEFDLRHVAGDALGVSYGTGFGAGFADLWSACCGGDRVLPCRIGAIVGVKKCDGRKSWFGGGVGCGLCV
jgi:hypothetical protein